jgi:hypothetical protein
MTRTSAFVLKAACYIKPRGKCIACVGTDETPAIADANWGETVTEVTRLVELRTDGDPPGLIDITPKLRDADRREFLGELTGRVKAGKDPNNTFAVNISPPAARFNGVERVRPGCGYKTLVAAHD